MVTAILVVVVVVVVLVIVIVIAMIVIVMVIAMHILDTRQDHIMTRQAAKPTNLSYNGYCCKPRISLSVCTGVK